MRAILFFLSATLLLFSCEESTLDKCQIPVTVRDLTGFDGCGFVFELESGHRLEPQIDFGFCGTPPLPDEVTSDPLYNFELHDGQRLLISYQVTNRPSICMVGPTIKVTCITEVATQNNE
ncbi:MAG: hypothetical protein L0Y35_06795 [Flammeovirgaceae bacterium]|nr:hypothetical protein [Flammeovirgaceae bacterium]